MKHTLLDCIRSAFCGGAVAALALPAVTVVATLFTSPADLFTGGFAMGLLLMALFGVLFGVATALPFGTPILWLLGRAGLAKPIPISIASATIATFGVAAFFEKPVLSIETLSLGIPLGAICGLASYWALQHPEYFLARSSETSDSSV